MRVDRFPLEATESVDTDNDGIGNNSDGCPTVPGVAACEGCPLEFCNGLPGDECSTAHPISAGTPLAVSTPMHTASAAPPADDAMCPTLNWADSRDTWFTFVAPANGSIDLDLCEATFDSSIVLYQGECGNLLRIGCGESGCVAGATNGTRIAGLDVSAGPVFIRIGGAGGASGDATLALSFTPGCVADLDGDGEVGGIDLGALLGAWGTAGADLDGNGTTDAFDLAAILGAWGPCQ